MRVECLFNRLLLLVFPEGEKRHTGHLHYLETHSWHISHGVTLSAESGNEHLVVIVEEREAAVLRHEGSDTLVVLLELHAHALSDSGVGLLGLDGDLLDHDSGSVRRATEGTSPPAATLSLVVVVICPAAQEGLA